MRIERGNVRLEKKCNGRFCAWIEGGTGHAHGLKTPLGALRELAVGYGIEISGELGSLDEKTIRYVKGVGEWTIFRGRTSVTRVPRKDLLSALCEALDGMTKPLSAAKVQEEFVKAWAPPPQGPAPSPRDTKVMIEIGHVGGNGWTTPAPKLPVWFIFPFDRMRPDYRVRTDLLQTPRLRGEAGACVAVCDDGRGLLILDLDFARIHSREAPLLVPEYAARVAALKKKGKRRKSK